MSGIRTERTAQRQSSRVGQEKSARAERARDRAAAPVGVAASARTEEGGAS
jgi:hypothetical protein